MAAWSRALGAGMRAPLGACRSCSPLSCSMSPLLSSEFWHFHFSLWYPAQHPQQQGHRSPPAVPTVVAVAGHNTWSPGPFAALANQLGMAALELGWAGARVSPRANPSQQGSGLRCAGVCVFSAEDKMRPGAGGWKKSQKAEKQEVREEEMRMRGEQRTRKRARAAPGVMDRERG